ncbi:Hint domain-containing protein, partial [Methylobacterium sp. Leaf88]|uniref:Hint domain-containing protein n=1 Tax=Methylobacterium sp. Leaf88 TaxID=1736244 RepID=UPI001FCCEB8E
MSDPPGYTLMETASTGSGDNLGVFGDTSNEPITVIQPDGTPYPQSLTYYGKTGTDGTVVRFPTTGEKAGSYVYILFTNQDGFQYNNPVSNVDQSPLALCFGSGTRILTTRGEVAVEDLQVGDRAVTASGRPRTITWTGHRDLGAERPLPADQSPIRIRAGAFGHGLPRHDLFLSPGHPVLVGADAEAQGGVLVPVMCLANGTTIARTSLARVSYWH